MLGRAAARDGRLTPDSRPPLAPDSRPPATLPGAISLLRPVLGLFAIAGAIPRDSVLPLAVVVVACVTDYFDGRIARKLAGDSMAGRYVDNLCDFAFLVCMFVFFADASLWSDPVRGWMPWKGANHLPLFALLASFGTYFARLRRDLAAGRTPKGSPRGHAAGVANYALAIVGAFEMLPGIDLGKALLEPVMLAVVLLNMVAVAENAVLMFQLQRGGPRMPA